MGEGHIQVPYPGDNPLPEMRKEKQRNLDSVLVLHSMLQDVAGIFSGRESFIVNYYRNVSS
jgi:hypothetical protein